MTTALFWLDTMMNALMLVLAVRLGSGEIRPIRILAGALAGAAAAQGSTWLALRRETQMLLWLPVAAIMMRIVRGRAARGSMVRQGMLLLCAAGFAGGMVLCFLGATGSFALAYVLGAASACCIGLCAARTRKTAQSVMRGKIAVAYQGRQASFDAMIDSGNTLRDYLTHLPVIVLPHAAAQRALHMEEKPLRPIFAQTAGGRQRMSVLSPVEIELDCHGIKRSVCAVIALSPRMSADVPALVPAALLDEQGN